MAMMFLSAPAQKIKFLLIEGLRAQLNYCNTQNFGHFVVTLRRLLISSIISSASLRLRLSIAL